MKAALAICLSLLLVMLQLFAAAPATDGCPPSVRPHDCGCGGRMACCAAHSPAPASPANTVNRSHGSDPVFLTAPAAAFPRLTGFTALADHSAAVGLARPSRGAPIFLRDCALLL